MYRSTVFQRDDIVVRLIDVTGELDADPVAALGVKGAKKAAELERLLDGAAIGVELLETERNINRLLSHVDMMPVTDRSATLTEGRGSVRGPPCRTSLPHPEVSSMFKSIHASWT